MLQHGLMLRRGLVVLRSLMLQPGLMLRRDLVVLRSSMLQHGLMLRRGLVVLRSRCGCRLTLRAVRIEVRMQEVYRTS